MLVASPLTHFFTAVTMFGMSFGFAVIKAEDLTDGIMPKRQVVGTGVTSSATQSPTSTQPPQSTSPVNSLPSSTEASTPAVSSTPQQQSTTQQQQASSSSIPTTVAITTTNSDGSRVTSHISTNTLEPTRSAVQTRTNSQGNSVVKIGTSTINPKTLSHKTTVTSALIGKATERRTSTSVFTSGGRVFSSVVTQDNIVSRTTGVATATIDPSLADGGGNGSNLTTSTKSIIGGVVGGIGGAILIGGLAFVAWRLWGKKKREEDMDDFNSSDSLRQEKSNRASGMTLASDGYSNPGGRVNTASNF